LLISRGIVRALTGHQAIFDGEILAFAEGRKLTFFDLQKRLGRKTEDDLFLGSSDVPVIFRAFDLLFFDGETLLRAPLQLRREKLESIAMPPALELAPIFPFAELQLIWKRRFTPRDVVAMRD
jgi:DNA ligase-1